MNRLKTVNRYNNIVFGIILLIGVAYITLFYQHKKEKVFVQPSDLVPIVHLKLIQKIEYTGRSGKTILEKENGNWMIKDPKVLQANPNRIDELLHFIGNLSVKKMHAQEPINLQNFSLSPALANLKLIAPTREFEISIGISNAIDQSSYLIFKNKEAIYQVSSFQLPLDKLDWKDFVDARLLMHNKKDIHEIQIRKGALSISLTNDGEKWQLKDSTLPSKEVENLIDFALGLKVQTLLDTLPNESLVHINREISQPIISITITHNSGLAKYSFSGPTAKIPGLEQMESVIHLGKSDLRDSPFTVSKETISSLDLLMTREGREQIISKSFEEQ